MVDLRARVKTSIKRTSSVSITIHQFDLDYQTNTQLYLPKYAFSPDENRHHGACNDSTDSLRSRSPGHAYRGLVGLGCQITLASYP
jgi:hypothetical protein